MPSLDRELIRLSPNRADDMGDVTDRAGDYSQLRTLCLDVLMQMVERPWGVAVYGAASVKAVPDLVRARFQVARVEQAPSRAFAVTSDVVRAVRQVLRAHQIPDASIERSRLDLKSLWSYAADRTFLGYQCKASFAVQSGNLDDVQQLLVDVVAAGANEIESVEFDVIAKPDLRAEARRQAVHAAKAKAELYAEAAGVRLGAVLHIEDVDPEGAGVERFRSLAAAGAADSGGDLAPGQVVVSAAVILGFAIAHD
jgi:uncharacterized protein